MRSPRTVIGLPERNPVLVSNQTGNPWTTCSTLPDGGIFWFCCQFFEPPQMCGFYAESYMDCQYKKDCLSARNMLSEFSNILQDSWWQHPTGCRITMDNYNCIDQCVGLFHQLHAAVFVLFDCLRRVVSQDGCKSKPWTLPEYDPEGTVLCSRWLEGMGYQSW